MSAEDVARRVTFRDVLANREFRALYIAQALSLLGDQLAKFAVALLVFERSNSPFLTALTYAVTYLPWLVGGPWLSVYADRLPRRHVMVVCDLARAVVILGIAIPHVPVAVALLLVGFVSLLQPPFNSARAALIPDVVGSQDHYSVAVSLSSLTNQLAQVLGFGLGGVVVGVLRPQGAIYLDCVSFLLSALTVARLVNHRPAHRSAADGAKSDRREALQFLLAEGPLRDALVIAYAVVAATIVPEAVAVPYAAAHHHGAIVAGLLTAAVPLGTVIGATILARFVPRDTAERWMRPLAISTALVLALTAFNPPPALALVFWTFGGAGSAMVITFNSFLGRLTPAPLRGRVFGLIGTGLAVVQGAAALVGGWIAEHVSPATAVADVALPALAILVVLCLRPPTTSSNDTNPTTSVGEEQAIEGAVGATQPRTRPEPRMWALTVAMGVLALLMLVFQRHDTPVLRVDVPVWWFFLLFFVVQAYPLEFEFRRVSRSVLLDSIALVLGLFFLSPVALVVTRLAAKTATTISVRRRSPLKSLFNIVGGAFYTCIAVVVFHTLLPAHPSVHSNAWLAAIAAVVVDDLAAALVVAYAGYIYDQRVHLRTMWQPVAFSLAVNLVNTCLGIVTAGAISYDSSNAWMITIFVVLTVAGFRTYHRLADRHAALDKLYAFAKVLGPITSDISDIGPALMQLRELLRAPALEIALLADDSPATVVVARDDESMTGVTVEHRSPDADTMAMVARPTSRAWWARRWRRRRSALSPQEMTVPVGGDERPIAVLRALTDAKGGRVFDRNDLRLLEAVADQLGAALEKGSLIQNLRRAATRDSLTGLANLDTLRAFLATMMVEDSKGVVLLIDIDRFHEINDTLGHDAGDAVLVEVAHRLEDAAAHGSLACRVGGDQFALVIPGQSSSELARLAALAVKSRVDGPLRLADVAADVRVTIGMARAPEHGVDATTILRRAEIAMGAAKGGAAGISEWEPHLERDGSRRLYVLAGLRQALAESELKVEFQPKLRLGTGEVTGFEALVRWRHPDLGLVPPSEFIPLAEATGLIGALTSSVLRLALETCRRWHDDGRNVGVAVNISARSLDDPVLVGQVAALLTATGLDGRALTLEITESSVMENPARSLEVLRQLRSLGIRLSIDDFGTGYSSLHQLRGLPVHEVKIDKTFVDNIDRDGADRAVIRAVVELCDSLGLVTVAEGVEQAGQAYALESLGVQEVQGYFYGRPMPESDATAWMRHRPIAVKEAEERQRG